MVWLSSAQSGQRTAVSPGRQPLAFWEEPVHVGLFCFRCTHAAVAEAVQAFPFMPGLVLLPLAVVMLACVVLRASPGERKVQGLL